MKKAVLLIFFLIEHVLLLQNEPTVHSGEVSFYKNNTNDKMNSSNSLGVRSIKHFYGSVRPHLKVKGGTLQLNGSNAVSTTIQQTVGQTLELKSNRSATPGSCLTRGGLRVEKMTCVGTNGSLDCYKPLPSGSLVLFTCPPYYKASATVSTCRDGNWTAPIKCESECGKVPSAATPLILHGRPAALGQLPWVAGYYLRIKGKWIASCGATLVADNAVITAAHCTWSQKKEDMLIALGLNQRILPENHMYVFNIKRVYVLPVFREATNLYNSDISILILQSPVQLSENILPACLPQPKLNVSFSQFTWGVVSGWGINENEKPSDTLHYIKVPVIDMVNCMRTVPKSFTKFMAFTSFCAGYTNGTGVCNGDSGSGLLIESDGQWVLHGVVSLSPRNGTSQFCHFKSYTLYTKVVMYMGWILNVLEFEDMKTTKN